MGKSRKRGDKEESSEKTIRELKTANRRLKSDNERLKAEIATLHSAFEKTTVYIKGNTDNVSVESIIEGVKKGNTLKQIKESEKCSKCGAKDLKKYSVPNVGTIVMCVECKDRKVLKNGIEQGQEV
jgi:hypothetical protein